MIAECSNYLKPQASRENGSYGLRTAEQERMESTAVLALPVPEPASCCLRQGVRKTKSERHYALPQCFLTSSYSFPLRNFDRHFTPLHFPPLHLKAQIHCLSALCEQLCFTHKKSKAFCPRSRPTFPILGISSLVRIMF